MTCARYADLDFVERYVLGQMDEAEQASFEAHFFECPDCLAAVQAMQAAQSVLRESAATPSPAQTATPASRVVDFSAHAARAKSGDSTGPSMSRGSRLLSSAGTWIGLAAAASLAGLLLWAPWHSRLAPAPSNPEPAATVAQQTPPKPESPGTVDRPAAATPPAASSSGASAATQTSGSQPSGTGETPKAPTPVRPPINLDTLALVMPPPYAPMQTRGADTGSGDAFAAAMTKYVAKDYRGAIEALKPVVEARPDAVDAQFFLGVSYLLANEPSAASDTLTRVAASNVAPFADEAHFYLAKAALRARDLDRADRELTLAIERQAGPPNDAAKLQQALRLYRRERNQDERSRLPD